MIVDEASSKGRLLGEFSHVNLHTHPLFWFVIGYWVAHSKGNCGLEGSWAQPEVTSPEVTKNDVTGTGSDRKSQDRNRK